MITAEEFLKSKGCEFNTYDIGKCFDGVEIKDVIEFAKLHIEAALNNIKKETQLWNDCAIIPYEKVVYPLENIK